VTVVGLGAHDTFAMARQFAVRHKMKTVKMLWDRSAASWTAYGVPGQPAALLVKDGTIVKSWLGPLDERAVESELS
jgi:hypothetical protein